jgi:DNA polymerase III delta prime subunit
MAHAYYTTGDLEQGIASAYGFVEQELDLPPIANPDVITLRHTSLSVDDVRRLGSLASQASSKGDKKAIIVSASRLFHEAQNAMLKLFEEPVPGLTLILIVPSEGVILPTLRSRLTALPRAKQEGPSTAEEFLALSVEDRKKRLEKIYNRSKSDKQEEKQEARREALELVQDLTRYFYAQDEGQMKRELLGDLTFFTKTLHERSAPLKLVFEHLQVVLPMK